MAARKSAAAASGGTTTARARAARLLKRGNAAPAPTAAAAAAAAPSSTAAEAVPTLPRDLRRRYDQQMRAWFGELRPLRLEGAGRFFNPPPALPIRSIFVPPALSASAIAPDAAEPSSADAADVLQWLDRHPRVVVLGDPGSGKSTLVAWLTWRLCAGLTEPLPAWCNGVLPVPLLLRDLALRAPLSTDDLLQAWLGSPLLASPAQLQPALGEALQPMLGGDGAKLLFLVDGLDELAAHLRTPVRDALRGAMWRWPQARFMITSRSVGYDECPVEKPSHAIELHFRALQAADRAQTPPAESWTALLQNTAVAALADAALEGVEHPSTDVRRLHVLPFDNMRINRFAARWFGHGETVQQRAEDLQVQFVDGLLRDPAALQIARTPNLLVMAAQVFGISNTLPDGRARLYEAITKAYLESIEQRYGLADARYSFEQKKSWLAALGWQMQLRRVDSKAPIGLDSTNVGRDLLVVESDVMAWLSHAMRDSGVEADASFVRGFVDAIARRSGLFIPRGEGLYAFSHLSIQEYFAALHLQTGMRELPVVDPAAYQALLDDLGQFASQPHWRETLITFFELPDWSPRMLPRLCDAVFGADLSRVPAASERAAQGGAPTNSGAVELLARLAAHPGLPLHAAWRQLAENKVFDYLRSERHGFPWPNSKVLTAFTANAEGCRRLWAMLAADPAALTGSAHELDLSDVQLRDWEPLRGFHHLLRLKLSRSNVRDLSLTSSMTRLIQLDLDSTPIESLGGLEHLDQLTHLSLSDTNVRDATPLSGLEQLELLTLDDTAITELEPLAPLHKMRFLVLNGMAVKDLSPLAGMAKLELLYLMRMPEPLDLSPLHKLTALHTLYLNFSQVRNLSGLDDKPGLEIHASRRP